MPLSFQGRTIGEVYYGDEDRVLHKIGEAHWCVPRDYAPTAVVWC